MIGPFLLNLQLPLNHCSLTRNIYIIYYLLFPQRLKSKSTDLVTCTIYEDHGSMLVCNQTVGIEQIAQLNSSY